MYLVVGANGYLGSYLIKNILEYTGENIIATDIGSDFQTENPRIKWLSCDISKKENIEELNQLTRQEKDLKIIYLPVFFNVNKNPENDKKAWNINVISFANFLDVMENVKSFYSISTDMLFKKDSDIPYNEHAEISPMNDYARHKAIEERMAEATGYNIVSLPVMMGPSLSPVKKHFYDDIILNKMEFRYINILYKHSIYINGIKKFRKKIRNSNLLCNRNACSCNKCFAW